MPDFIADQLLRERQERAHRGADQCREALEDVALDHGFDLAEQEAARGQHRSGSELIHYRALQRARTERREATLRRDVA